MSCPICDHTMSLLHTTSVALGPIYWCPRCGTVQVRGDNLVPKLAERCREFEETLVVDALLAEGKGAVAAHQAKWHTLGIAEAIHKPKERPQ